MFLRLLSLPIGAALALVSLRYSYQQNLSSQPVGGLSSILLRSQKPGGKIKGEDAW